MLNYYKKNLIQIKLLKFLFIFFFLIYIIFNNKMYNKKLCFHFYIINQI